MELIVGDCLEVMEQMPVNSVDLVFTSPPYENVRSYDIGFDLTGDEYVAWVGNDLCRCETSRA